VAAGIRSAGGRAVVGIPSLLALCPALLHQRFQLKSGPKSLDPRHPSSGELSNFYRRAPRADIAENNCLLLHKAEGIAEFSGLRAKKFSLQRFAATGSVV